MSQVHWGPAIERVIEHDADLGISRDWLHDLTTTTRPEEVDCLSCQSSMSIPQRRSR